MKTIWFPFKQSPSGDEGGGGSPGSTTTDNTKNENSGGGEDATKRIKELEAQLASANKEKETLGKKASTLAQDLEKIRTEGLKSKEDYKTYSEALEKKLEEAEGKATRFQEAVVHTNRVMAVKDAASKLGLRSAAIGDIESMDLEDVKVSVGEDRMIRVEGAGEFANRLKTTKPYLFETPKDPNFNGGGGAGGGSGGAKVSKADLEVAFANRNKGPKEKAHYQSTLKSYNEQTKATAK